VNAVNTEQQRTVILAALTALQEGSECIATEITQLLQSRADWTPALLAQALKSAERSSLSSIARKLVIPAHRAGWTQNDSPPLRELIYKHLSKQFKASQQHKQQQQPQQQQAAAVATA